MLEVGKFFWLAGAGNVWTGRLVGLELSLMLRTRQRGHDPRTRWVARPDGVPLSCFVLLLGLAAVAVVNEFLEVHLGLEVALAPDVPALKRVLHAPEPVLVDELLERRLNMR